LALIVDIDEQKPGKLQRKGQSDFGAGEKTQMELTRLEGFAGPLPPPEYFAQYEQACPGSAERILAMAEHQATHRCSMENKTLEAAIEDRKQVRLFEKRGQFCGLTIGVVAIVAGASVAILNPGAAAWAGTFISCSGIASIVGAFIYDKRAAAAVAKSDENEERLQPDEKHS